MRILILMSLCFTLISCEIKDSVFDTEIKTPKLWNQKFMVPSYNLGGGDVAKFAIISDSHQNYSDLREVIRNINNSDAQFAVHTGDFTDFGSGDEYELFIEYIKELKIPLYVVPGNHDLTAGGLKLYNRAFGQQNRSVVTDFGKLIFFNDNKLETKFTDFNFLTTEIGSANNARPVFVFHHQNPYNDKTYSAADNAVYTAALQSHPQVVVFHGHLHRFFTQTQNTIPFFQINRSEGGKWGYVQVDNSNIRVYYCTGKNCALESTL